ncbi:hypothetical protein SUGI_0895440 [Cryptomeria japonica]|uniref:protein GLUTAMINE DUMPER 4-like n=1 Tax=Cryptomeria japonica TaxID=3369 RepID=UPI002414ACD9|nr:protein GLUTAMINE DUMPER 4-like [Cryptomeria japonica]GLJ43145.1 hypothetical protein SUGI_0895440 [Cryptomeria japonica]
MRNISSASSTGSSPHSPIPYLLGGIGAMLALVIFSLLLLVCSMLRRSSRNDHGGTEKIEMGKKINHGNGCDEMEKRVVVIMAGDDNPTFIAEPASIAAPAI